MAFPSKERNGSSHMENRHLGKDVGKTKPQSVLMAILVIERSNLRRCEMAATQVK